MVSLILLLLVGVAYGVSSTILARGFGRLEEASVKDQVRIAVAGVESIFEELDGTVRDWAGWDAARLFVKKPDPHFVAENLSSDTLADLRLDALLLLNERGEVAYGTGFDYTARSRRPLPRSLLSHLRAGSPALQFAPPDYSTRGLIRLPEGLMAIVVRPFHPAHQPWMREGTLVFGRFLDEQQLRTLRAEINLPVVIEPVQDVSSTPRPDENDDPPHRSPTVVTPEGARKIRGATVLYDLYEDPVARLSVDLPRPMHEQAQTMQHLLAWLMGSGALLVLVVIAILDRMVLDRLSVLSQDVSRIGARADLSERLPVRSGDELGGLSRALNEALEALQLAHERQRETDARYRAVVEQTSESILLVDPDGDRILEANPATGKLLGCPNTEMEGISFRQLVREDPEGQGHLPDRLGAEPFTAGLRMQCAGGPVAEVEARINRISLNGREVWCVMLRDVTEHRHLEAQLRQAQKMEAVGRLAGGIAHDFNNMLAVIGGHCEILLQDPYLAEDVRSGLLEIKYAGERSASLTRQLLAYSRKQILAPRVLCLQEVIRSLYPLLLRLVGEDVELVAELDTPIGMVRADPSQMEQVLMNLVVNARDAMPTGGRLILHTDEVRFHEARLIGAETLPAGTYVRLTVSDTGTGMDAATQARLFEPFFTTKELGKGTGLGMATVYGIVRQSEGFIEVESAPGAGTRFHIYLPRVGDPLPPDAASRE